MKARNSLTLLALFALAFLGSLFALRRMNPVAVEPAKVTAVAPSPRMTAARVTAAPVLQALPEVVSAVAAPAAVEWQPTVEPQATVEAHAVERRATSSPVPNVEQPAVAALQAVGAPFTEMRDAVDALRQSTNPSDRLRAVEFLAAAAREGHDVPSVRTSLRLASADVDSDVSARAQDEYERLVERDDR